MAQQIHLTQIQARVLHALAAGFHLVESVNNGRPYIKARRAPGRPDCSKRTFQALLRKRVIKVLIKRKKDPRYVVYVRCENGEAKFGRKRISHYVIWPAHYTINERGIEALHAA